MRVLIVEDDAVFAQGVTAFLQQEGFAVDCVPDLAGARLSLRTQQYALVILDVGLPDGSGLSLLGWLRAPAPPERATPPDTPVLILSARAGVDDVIEGLDAGSDDYVVKPVDRRTLAARVRTLLRRAQGRNTPDIAVGELLIDCARRQARLRGEPVALSAREWSLLHALAAKPGAVLSRAELENALYSAGEEIESNAIEVHVHHLRRKLGEQVIRTLRGAGYALRV